MERERWGDRGRERESELARWRERARGRARKKEGEREGERDRRRDREMERAKEGDGDRKREREREREKEIEIENDSKRQRDSRESVVSNTIGYRTHVHIRVRFGSSDFATTPIPRDRRCIATVRTLSPWAAWRQALSAITASFSRHMATSRIRFVAPSAKCATIVRRKSDFDPLDSRGAGFWETCGQPCWQRPCRDCLPLSMWTQLNREFTYSCSA